jgi:predicted RNase H-like nuclease (RuvC/YqgF family)
MADLKSFKIETPKNLDAIFNLDCFKYTEMKGLFKQIYEYLSRVGLKISDLDAKVGAIPNFDGVTKAIKDLEKRVAELEKRTRKNEEDILETRVDLQTKIDNNHETLVARDGHLETRIAVLEEEVEALKNRPLGNTNVDTSGLASNDELLSLLARLEATEKRNLEQDERLTNNELRIEKLEKMISDPLERIMALERRCDNMQVDLNNKVSVSDLYNELLKKADINGLKALEASLLRLNDLINDLASQFADKVENDKAHKLL